MIKVKIRKILSILTKKKEGFTLAFPPPSIHVFLLRARRGSFLGFVRRTKLQWHGPARRLPFLLLLVRLLRRAILTPKPATTFSKKKVYDQIQYTTIRMTTLSS